jgi:hypothetical protein
LALSLYSLTKTTAAQVVFCLTATHSWLSASGPRRVAFDRRLGLPFVPPRLPGQPIFYPVLNEEYATQIARDWNTKDSQSKAGYVTRFAVRTSYLSQFKVQKVGGSAHLEYWIPAEKLAEFNQNIVGLIEVISEFRGQ